MDTATPRQISVTRPVGQALDWAHHVAFTNFDPRKWFTLGFCAWLAWLGRHGSPSFNWNWQRDSLGGARFDDAANWAHTHWGVLVALATIGAVLIVGLILLFGWLSSRGMFMFLDGTIHNRGRVATPWNEFRERGARLFVFRLVIGLCAGGVMILLALLLGGGIWGLGESIESPGSFLLLFLWAGVFAVVVIVLVLIGVAINDFVVPIMWLRNHGPLEAWAELSTLLGRHTGAFLGYILMRFVLSIAIGVAACLAACVTCCIAALPYIGTVILLPLYVFRRSYSIYFLSQLDPDYAPLAPAISVHPPGGGSS